MTTYKFIHIYYLTINKLHDSLNKSYDSIKKNHGWPISIGLQVLDPTQQVRVLPNQMGNLGIEEGFP